MKNLTFFLLIILFLSGCQSDDEMINISPLNQPINIDIIVEDEYYSIEESGYAVLSDADDNIISQSTLLNGSIIKFVVEDSLATETYNLTLIKEDKEVQSPNELTHQFHTFLNVSSSTITLKNDINLNPFELKSKITISDVEDSSRPYEYPYSFSGSASSPDDDLNCTFTLKSIPEDVIFTYKADNEEFPRYIKLLNLAGGENLVVQHNQTKVMDNHVTLDYPDYDFVNNSIWGYTPEDVERRLSFHQLNGATNSSIHYFPPNMYSTYRLRQLLVRGDKYYNSITFSDTVLNNYVVPDLDLEVINNNPLDFIANSPSDFDYFTNEFIFKNTAETIYTSWKVHGLQNPQIDFRIPDFLDTIDYENDLSFSIDSLNYQQVTIYKYEGLDEYGEFMDYILDPFARKEPFTKAESLYIF